MKRRGTKLFLVLCLIFTMSSSSVFAATTSRNEGLSTTLPANPLINNGGGMSTDSASMPGKTNPYTNGTVHYVSGIASTSELFTDKCFNGVSSIYYEITNRGTEPLTITLYKWTFWGPTSGETSKIPVNGTQYYSFSGLNSGSYYFIQFDYPSNFSGTVLGNQ